MTTLVIGTGREALTVAGRHAARRCLRDELFVLAHDEDYRWRPRIRPASLAVGLAGAMLVDLLLFGDLHANSGHVAARSRYVRHDLDPIAAQVVAGLAMTRAWIPLREAITGTAANLYERTLIQLVKTNVVATKARRFGRGVRCWPADGNDVVNARHFPRHRAPTLDRSTTTADPATDALCALIRALRIEATLYLELELAADDLRVRLDTITSHYAANHPEPRLAAIPGLITAVEAASARPPSTAQHSRTPHPTERTPDHEQHQARAAGDRPGGGR